MIAAALMLWHGRLISGPCCSWTPHRVNPPDGSSMCCKARLKALLSQIKACTFWLPMQLFGVNGPASAFALQDAVRCLLPGRLM